MENNVYDFIKSQENKWRTERVPLTKSKDWNMLEHIERCYNVANGWFHKGNNEDDTRPYDDLVTPIVDFAFRAEGFDVKDITPYVDDAKQHYKSTLVKKFHPDWATKNQLNDFIDEFVESSIIYDLVIVKDINETKPEVIDLRTLAFCDQTDASNSPLCIRHQFTPQDLQEMKGKWDSDAIDMAIVTALESKKVNIANDQTAETPSKYIEVYELRGSLPEYWLKDDGEMYKYVPQMHIVCYYTTTDGNRNGITLYKGEDKDLKENFLFFKIDKVRSKGRACGRSIVERLFQPQVWNNYSAIKLKKMMDGIVNLLQTDSLEVENQKLKGLPEFTILKTEQGKGLSRVDMGLQNVQVLTGNQDKQAQNARMLGSASEGALGVNPSSGTPFALENLIVQNSEGMHQYRQGKIAIFFADVLYPKIILPHLVKEMSNGKTFSAELSLDEITDIAETIATNETNDKIKEMILDGKIVTEEMQQSMTELLKSDIMNGKTTYYKNGLGFFETFKGEIKDIPIKVKINVVGKQKYLAKEADKLSRLISQVLANPQAFAQIPGLGKLFNQLIESAGLNPIDFKQVIKGVQMAPDIKTKQVSSPVGEDEVKEE